MNHLHLENAINHFFAEAFFLDEDLFDVDFPDVDFPDVDLPDVDFLVGNLSPTFSAPDTYLL